MNKKLFVLLLSFFSATAMAGNDFTGPHAGVSLGYVNGNDSGKEYVSGVFDNYTQSTDPKGGLLGVFAGYNWTLENNLLVGIEGDYDARSVDDMNLSKLSGVSDSRYPVKTDQKAAASLRGRLGYLFNTNKSMAYVTAGYATAKVKRTFHNLSTPTSQSITKWQDGWTAGFGVEHAVMDKWSVRAEYRYADYGNKSVKTDQVYGINSEQKQDYDEHSVRVSASYHF